MLPSRRPTSKPLTALDVRELESLLLPDDPLSDDPDADEGDSGRVAKAKRKASGDAPVAIEPVPDALRRTLADLTMEDGAADWADRTLQCLEQLYRIDVANSQDAIVAVSQLDALRVDADRLAASLGDSPVAGRVSRAGYALERRLAVWRHRLAMRERKSKAAPRPAQGERELQGLAMCVGGLRKLTQGTPEGRAWSEYLALDALGDMASRRAKSSAAERQALTRTVLQRISELPMSRNQRQFLSQAPFEQLRRELRRWAYAPVGPREVLEHLEHYEQDQLPSSARLVAMDCRRLAASAEPGEQVLGRELESYYRNANVRIVVAGELMNRLIPKRPPEYGCVHDVVLGTPVRGRSVMSTQIGVRLIPDPQRLRVALEINGLVSTLTESSAGPAVFYNDSQSTYRAWKEVELSPAGLMLKPAQVAVNNETQLRGLETDFDVIPLVGSLVQEVARSQHEARRDEMRSEVMEKISTRAKSQIDGEADARLKELATRFHDRVLAPLSDLALGPEVIGAETTDRRIVLRLRLASDGQLGSHTPRPRAPSDSLVSMQIHESALNNTLQQIQLEGNTFTLPELRRRIALRFNRPEVLRGAEEQEDITVAFAPKNAVRVECRDGCVDVVLSIAKLTRQSKSWENFRVRVSYRPEVGTQRAVLVRDETIHLEGKGLSARTQLPLRAVFGRVFPKDPPLRIVPERIAADERMVGLIVSQFAVDDGWLALAVSPARPDPGRTVLRREDHLTR